MGQSANNSVKNDKEDMEADKVFEKVEDYIDGRRRRKREEKFQEHQDKLLKQQSDIRAQFQDLKRNLASVSREDWEVLPEAPDLVKKTKKQRMYDQAARYTPIPDSALSS